jgi:penicillin-binding protein 1C
VLTTAHDELLITSPLPGSIYVVDPDVPSSRRIPLIANGTGKVEWQSDSLTCRSEAQGNFAVAVEGEHRIVVTDPVTGRQAETRIRIRFL